MEFAVIELRWRGEVLSVLAVPVDSLSEWARYAQRYRFGLEAVALGPIRPILDLRVTV